MRRMTLDLAQLQAGESVLDVGCGTGTLTRLARERVGESGKVYGIDAAPQMITVARRQSSKAQPCHRFSGWSDREACLS